jgi:hypothetical protein
MQADIGRYQTSKSPTINFAWTSDLVELSARQTRPQVRLITAGLIADFTLLSSGNLTGPESQHQLHSH